MFKIICKNFLSNSSEIAAFRYFSTKVDLHFVNSLLPTSNDFEASEVLQELLQNVPDLQDCPSHMWKRTFHVFQNHGFQIKNIINMISKYPNLLQCRESQVDNALELWRNYQFGEHLEIMLKEAPSLIEVSESHLINCIPKLESYVGTKRKVSKVLMRCPNVVFENWANVEQKLNYLMNNMKIEIPEIIKSSALKRTLPEIKCRHIFLQRLGIFEIRKGNSSGELSKKNPNLSTITDTTDYLFAKEIANITYEEFAVFKKLYQKEFEKNDEDDEGDDIDEDDV